MIIHETAHLQVDCLDDVTVYLPSPLSLIDEPIHIGALTEGMDWPAWLGPEPNWWLTEVAELYDRWHDGARFARDCRETAMDAFNRAKGI